MVAIDDTPIGTFVEIEGDEAAIHALAARLGFAPADYITASYRALFVAAAGPRRRRHDRSRRAVPPVIDTALILAAGLGTRLAPLSARAREGGAARGRRRARSAGRSAGWPRPACASVVVNLHHLPATVTAALGHGDDLGVAVRYSWEPQVLGSAGGPRQALDLDRRATLPHRERRHAHRPRPRRPRRRARAHAAAGHDGRVAARRPATTRCS